jgi:hypothetical protein
MNLGTIVLCVSLGIGSPALASCRALPAHETSALRVADRAAELEIPAPAAQDKKSSKDQAKKAEEPRGWIRALGESIRGFFKDNFTEVDLRYFEPKLRVYVDTGTDDDGEIDIFKNGALSPTFDLAQLLLSNTTGMDGDWKWGFQLAAGVTSPAGDSEDGMEEATNAPVILMSAGTFLSHRLSAGDDAMWLELEFGWVRGFTADEAFENNDDSAIYFGLTPKNILKKK